MTAAWITVFSGPFAEALALRSVLEARGIPAVIPDEMTKTMDPFVTGANPFAVEVCVPASTRDEATEILDRAKGAKLIARRSNSDLATPSSDPEGARVVALGRRVNWCLLVPGFGWALGAYLGLVYERAANRLTKPPHGYWLTAVIWVLQIALLAWGLVWAWGRDAG